MIRRGIALWLFAAGAAACAPAPVPAAASDLTVFDTRADPGFGDATLALETLLAAASPRPTGPQHFCIVGYRSDQGKSAWVDWREGRRLIFWGGVGDPDYAKDALVDSRRVLDLGKDVRATQAEVGSSTYLVTKSWVAKTKADCAAHGAQYSVNTP